MCSVRGNWRRCSIALILLICIAAPVVELFDQWDQSVRDDSEATVVLVALCVGVALVAARVLTRPTIQSSRYIAAASKPVERRRAALRLPFADAGPPLILRV